MKNRVKILITAFVAIFLYLNTGNVYAQSGAERGAGTGAFLGAMAGAIFGDGDVVGDVLEGAFVGGGVGAIAGALSDDGRQRLDRETQKEIDELIKAFGEDNLRGYVELINCNHDRAIALFRVGQIADKRDHRLTGYWLEAVAEKDRKNSERAAALYDVLIKRDPDIDDEEMASIQLNRIVLDLRSDRRANDITPCY